MLVQVIMLMLSATVAHSQVLPLGYPCEFLGATHPNNATHCPKQADCSGQEKARFRSIDGTCNNLMVNNLWGSSGSPFSRLVPRNPLYHFSYPPMFVARGSRFPLPNARRVSAVVHSGRDQPSTRATLMVMQVGQFLDHDLTLTPEMNLCKPECPATEEINCCDFVGKKQHPKSCWPIDIPPFDAFFSVHHPEPTCLDFKRSQPFPCTYSYETGKEREQFNLLTSFTDNSAVYGSTDSQAANLREHRDGLLRTSKDGSLLPLAEPTGCEEAMEEDTMSKAFVAGDDRVNENPGLQAQHTLWVREHNRLAAHFKELNPERNDEELFQEARRFVIAEWQNIVHSEFLRIVLGPKLLKRLGLNVDTSSLYNPYLSPNIFNGFATAAFRFGHSLISTKFDIKDEDMSTVSEFLSDHFFDIGIVHTSGIDGLMRGMIMQSSEAANNLVTSEVQSLLFKAPGSTFGQDLVARNIQRGRDHELGTYEAFRLTCGLAPLPGSFFSQPPKEFTREVWSRFSRVYKYPREIELFPGGMSEIVVPGGLVGPTFACIIGEQFRKLKFGDRYFFTHTNVHQNLRFCKEDLERIRMRTLSDVVCDNTDLDEVPSSTFMVQTGSDEMISCDEINRLEPSFGCYAEENDFDLFHEEVEDPHSEHVAVIAGGYNGWKLLDSVEVYSPNGMCQHQLAHLPEPTYGLYLFYVDKILMACGGRTPSGMDEKRCWRYERDGGKGKWVHDEALDMITPRWRGAGVKIGERYYVTGGLYSSNSSEYFDPYLYRWVPGPALYTPRYEHCVVSTDKEMLLMGGSAGSTLVESLDLNAMKWYTKKDLIGFRNKHSCTILPDGDTVLSVGGSVLSSYYKISSGSSYFGANNILARGFGNTINLNGRILAMGGESHSTVVEELDMRRGVFKSVPARLAVGRSRFAATTVPAKLFQHLPGGCKP